MRLRSKLGEAHFFKKKGMRRTARDTDDASILLTPPAIMTRRQTGSKMAYLQDKAGVYVGSSAKKRDKNYLKTIAQLKTLIDDRTVRNKAQAKVWLRTGRLPCIE